MLKNGNSLPFCILQKKHDTTGDKHDFSSDQVFCDLKFTEGALSDIFFEKYSWHNGTKDEIYNIFTLNK